MTDAKTSVNAEGVFEPFPISEVPWQEFTRGERFGMRFQVLSDFGGGSQITVAMEVLDPGRQANQLHYHLLEEEHVLVLEGSMTVQLGERRHIVEAGHYVCFPAGQKVGHALTGRVSVKLTGESYRTTPTVGYWDDVDA